MAGWTAAKILWIRENEPELFAKCRHIMLPKDYVRFILTGKYATDASDASGMQMLDVKNRCWSQEILDFLKVDRELLGDVYESPEVVGNLLPKLQRSVDYQQKQLWLPEEVIMPVQQLEQVL